MKHIEAQKNCVGCKICINECSFKAIHLIIDKYGFWRPEVNTQKCVNCGKCLNVCPLNFESQKAEGTFDLYGLKIKDTNIRKKSSSGGAFSALAQYVLDNHGIVYGCKLDKNLKAVYGRAETWDECELFMGAKYVQSDMDNILSFIRNDLRAGKTVLFTGTPCYCAAIRHNIKGYTHNGTLLLCDFLCHGIPSPSVYEDFKALAENKYHGSIISLVFRDKEKIKRKPSCRGIRFQIQCHKKNHLKILDVYNPKLNNIYFELFKFNYILRESCYSCLYTGFNRYTDITISDYWGCESQHPEFFDREGISLVLINTATGKQIWESISHKFYWIKVQKDEVLQAPLLHPPFKPNDYEKVWDIYQKKGLYTAGRYVNKTHKGSIATRCKMALKYKLPPKIIFVIKSYRRKSKNKNKI